jgi:hypothetical protein
MIARAIEALNALVISRREEKEERSPDGHGRSMRSLIPDKDLVSHSRLVGLPLWTTSAPASIIDIFFSFLLSNDNMRYATRKT